MTGFSHPVNSTGPPQGVPTLSKVHTHFKMPLICKIDETKPNKIINTKTITQYLADDNVHIIHNSTADKKEKNQQNKSNSNYKSKTPPPPPPPQKKKKGTDLTEAE